MPQYCFALVNKNKSNKNTTLDSMLTNSALFLVRIGQTVAKDKINEIKQYVEMMLNPLSHTERGIDRHKGEIKAVINLLDDLETEFIAIRYSKMPILPKNTDLYLTLIKDAVNTYKFQIRLKEDLFIYDDAGNIRLSKCLTDSVYFWHYQNGAVHNEGNFQMHSKNDIEVSYVDITSFATINIPVVAGWQSLFSKNDGTPLNTLMIL
jgi:hypothetical protein